MGVVVLGAIDVVFGVIALFAAGAAFLLGDRAVAWLLIALGATMIIAGFGLWMLAAWAWYLALAVAVLDIAASGLGVVLGGELGIGRVLVDLVIIAYLVATRSHFIGGHRAPETQRG